MMTSSGGQSALQRMYRDIQEPMLDAAQNQFGSNPFQALGGNNAAGSAQQRQQQSGENAAPLPNPWGGGGGGSSTSGKTPKFFLFFSLFPKVFFFNSFSCCLFWTLDFLRHDAYICALIPYMRSLHFRLHSSFVVPTWHTQVYTAHFTFICVMIL